MELKNLINSNGKRVLAEWKEITSSHEVENSSHQEGKGEKPLLALGRGPSR